MQRNVNINLKFIHDIKIFRDLCLKFALLYLSFYQFFSYINKFFLTFVFQYRMVNVSYIKVLLCFLCPRILVSVSINFLIKIYHLICLSIIYICIHLSVKKNFKIISYKSLFTAKSHKGSISYVHICMFYRVFLIYQIRCDIGHELIWETVLSYSYCIFHEIIIQ